ncbi:MAG TPA: histidine kinase dimerization/phospho-acceptor domain-containing protein [bacterium]
MAMPEEPALKLESRRIREELSSTVGQSAFQQFHNAFALMSCIPLLIVAYLLAARLFTIQVFEGWTGFLFLVAIVIALLGFLIGRRNIQRVLDSLIEANVRLRRQEQMRAVFMGNVVHDLKSPLAAIQLSLSNLSDGLLGTVTAEQKETAQACQDIAGRLIRLATSLQEFSRAGADGSKSKQVVFALGDAVQEAVRIRESYFKIYRRSITMALPEPQVLFLGDREQLTQAYGGLLEKAVQDGIEGTPITVTLGRVNTEWRLTVEFQRAAGPDNPDAEAGGQEMLGLGIQLATDVVKLHCGQLWSEQANGTTRLVIALPELDPSR